MLKKLKVMMAALPLALLAAGGTAQAASTHNESSNGHCAPITFKQWVFFDVVDVYQVPAMANGTGTSVDGYSWYNGNYQGFVGAYYFTCEDGVISVNEINYSGSYYVWE